MGKQSTKTKKTMFTNTFRVFSSGVRVGAHLNKIQLVPGSWSRFANQTDIISKEVSQWNNIAKGPFYARVNLGTKPGADHTDVTSLIIFENVEAASKSIDMEPYTRTKLAEHMVKPPQKLLSDGLTFTFADFAKQGH